MGIGSHSPPLLGLFDWPLGGSVNSNPLLKRNCGEGILLRFLGIGCVCALGVNLISSKIITGKDYGCSVSVRNVTKEFVVTRVEQ